MGFLGWIGNILEREKPVDAATGWLFHDLRPAAVSVLLVEHTARVGLWNRLAPVCHLRWGRCENHKTTSGSSGIVRSSRSLPYSSMAQGRGDYRLQLAVIFSSVFVFISHRDVHVMTLREVTGYTWKSRRVTCSLPWTMLQRTQVLMTSHPLVLLNYTYTFTFYV